MCKIKRNLPIFNILKRNCALKKSNKFLDKKIDLKLTTALIVDEIKKRCSLGLNSNKIILYHNMRERQAWGTWGVTVAYIININWKDRSRKIIHYYLFFHFRIFQHSEIRFLKTVTSNSLKGYFDGSSGKCEQLFTKNVTMIKPMLIPTSFTNLYSCCLALYVRARLCHSIPLVIRLQKRKKFVIFFRFIFSIINILKADGDHKEREMIRSINITVPHSLIIKQKLDFNIFEWSAFYRDI
ncbi:hypothetical protein BpHYR1_042994 [Brachionus plicatilis]|uniref:RNA-directed DNA polymerase from mobile element jockey-like n=1 Tax=Brachionus plicatilis TaxID=10195 RepID=A0A3M7SMC0_BRAPC|nr:hypothetical protein BpHYR1_042994 [Brachionus plicatilis]